MKDFYASFKKSRWFPLATGIVMIIFGILCISNPSARMEMVATYLGLAVLLYGFVMILSGILTREDGKAGFTNIAFGVVLAVLAVIIFANKSLIGKYLPTLTGFIMILIGGADLFRAVVLLKNGVKTWWIGAIPALIVLVLGFIFLLSPGYVGQTIGIFTGLGLIVTGVSGLIHFIQFNKEK